MGSVIRGQSNRGVPVFSFVDLEQQANDIVRKAQSEAQCLIAQAREKGAKLAARERTGAYTRGHEEGRAAGRAAGLEEIRKEARQAALDAARTEARGNLAKVTGALAAGLQAFEAQRRALHAAAEAGLVELSLAIARRVCKLALEHAPEVARANARALLEMVQHDADVTLHLCPADHAFLEQTAPAFVAEIAGRRHVQFVPDPEVPAGGCVLKSGASTIDARTEAQLDRVARVLFGKDEAPPVVEAEPPA